MEFKIKKKFKRITSFMLSMAMILGMMVGSTADLTAYAASSTYVYNSTKLSYEITYDSDAGKEVALVSSIYSNTSTTDIPSVIPKTVNKVEVAYPVKLGNNIWAGSNPGKVVFPTDEIYLSQNTFYGMTSNTPGYGTVVTFDTETNKSTQFATLTENGIYALVNRGATSIADAENVYKLQNETWVDLEDASSQTSEIEINGRLWSMDDAKIGTLSFYPLLTDDTGNSKPNTTTYTFRKSWINKVVIKNTGSLYDWCDEFEGKKFYSGMLFYGAAIGEFTYNKETKPYLVSYDSDGTTGILAKMGFKILTDNGTGFETLEKEFEAGEIGEITSYLFVTCNQLKYVIEPFFDNGLSYYRGDPDDRDFAMEFWDKCGAETASAIRNTIFQFNDNYLYVACGIPGYYTGSSDLNENATISDNGIPGGRDLEGNFVVEKQIIHDFLQGNFYSFSTLKGDYGRYYYNYGYNYPGLEVGDYTLSQMARGTTTDYQWGGSCDKLGGLETSVRYNTLFCNYTNDYSEKAEKECAIALTASLFSGRQLKIYDTVDNNAMNVNLSDAYSLGRTPYINWTNKDIRHTLDYLVNGYSNIVGTIISVTNTSKIPTWTLTDTYALDNVEETNKIFTEYSDDIDLETFNQAILDAGCNPTVGDSRPYGVLYDDDVYRYPETISEPFKISTEDDKPDTMYLTVGSDYRQPVYGGVLNTLSLDNNAITLETITDVTTGNTYTGINLYEDLPLVRAFDVEEYGENIGQLVFSKTLKAPTSALAVGVKAEFSVEGAQSEESIVGAEMQVIDASTKNVVDEWTTTDDTHMSGLTEGNYILKMVAAPDGYKVSSDVAFTVTQGTSLTGDKKIVMTVVSDAGITKLNGEDNTVLTGADLSIYKQDDTIKIATPSNNTDADITTYATKDELENSFTPDDSGTAKNIGKIIFGKDSDGDEQEWYILGKDDGVSGDNTAIFADSNMLSYVSGGDNSKLIFQQKYNEDIAYNETTMGTYTSGSPVNNKVSPNHYGASDIRNTLQSMEKDTDYFNTTEQSLMNTTTVQTDDFRTGTDTNDPSRTYLDESMTYDTTDKLYLGAWDYDGLNANHPYATGADRTKFYIGSETSKKVLPMSTYWAVRNGWFWLRSPYSDRYLHSLHADPGDGVDGDLVDLGSYGVRPASNINLSSVLFASSALPSKEGMNAITSGTSMRLRLDGNSDEAKKALNSETIGTATYTSDIITVNKGTTTNDTYLYIQSADEEGNDWFYGIKIEKDTKVYKNSLNRGYDLSKCKIWLETTGSDGMIYAISATESDNTNAISLASEETATKSNANSSNGGLSSGGITGINSSVTVAKEAIMHALSLKTTSSNASTSSVPASLTGATIVNVKATSSNSSSNDTTATSSNSSLYDEEGNILDGEVYDGDETATYSDADYDVVMLADLELKDYVITSNKAVETVIETFDEVIQIDENTIYYNNKAYTKVVDFTEGTYNEALEANGNYLLVENEAPTGYQLADPIAFTVDNNGGYSVVMVDYPIWETIKVSYELDGGNNTNPDEIDRGTSEYALTTPTKKGYEFTGWTVTNGIDKASVSDATLKLYFTDEDFEKSNNQPSITLKANWEKSLGHITYNDGTKTETVDVDFTNDDPFNLPEPKKDGYDFVGWATKSDATASDSTYPAGYDAKKIPGMDAGESIDLYAIFTPKATTIILDPNGGEGTATPITVDNKSSNSYPLPDLSNTFTKKGYSFVGWQRATGSDATIYKVGTNAKDMAGYESTYGTTIKLNAVWSGKPTEVIYVSASEDTWVKYPAGGVDNTTADASSIPDNSYFVENYDYWKVKDGYTFVGWSTSSNASNIDAYKLTDVTIYKAGDNVKTVDGYEYGKTITLYPVWNPKSSHITFDLNGGEGTIADIEIDNLTSEEIALPQGPTKAGYLFTGWKDTGNNIYYPESNARNIKIEPDKTVTLTAQWQAITYYIKYCYIDTLYTNPNTGETTDTGTTQYHYWISRHPMLNNWSKGLTVNSWTKNGDDKATITSDSVDTLRFIYRVEDKDIEYNALTGTYSGVVDKNVAIRPYNVSKDYYDYDYNWLRMSAPYNYTEYNINKNYLCDDITADATIGSWYEDNTDAHATVAGYAYGSNIYMHSNGRYYLKNTTTGKETDLGYYFNEEGKGFNFYYYYYTKFDEHKYDITYDVNVPTDDINQATADHEGDNYGAETTLNLVDTAGLYTNPVTRSDYFEFLGWYLNKELTEGEKEVTSLPKDVGNKPYSLTLFAQYKQQKFDVTYTTEDTGDIVDTTPITETYTVGKAFNYLGKKAFDRKGYYITNWKLNGTDKTVEASKSDANMGAFGESNDLLAVHSDTKSYTLEAVYEPIEYKIEYIDNGGDMSSCPTSWSIDEGSSSLPTPTKAHYDFSGWSVNGNPVTAITDDLIQYAVNDTITITANFGEHLYTVIYDKNIPTGDYKSAVEGENYQSSEQFGIETTKEIKNPLTRDYWSFDGWYTSKTGGDKVEWLPDSAGDYLKDMTLYARYTQKQFDVTYQTDNPQDYFDMGTPSPVTETYNVGESYTYPNDASYRYRFQKHGYFINGWMVDDSGISKKVDPNTTDTNMDKFGKSSELTSVHSDTKKYTLTAQYSPCTYDISFIGDGTKTKKITGVPYKTNLVDLLSTYEKPSKKGYTFIGYKIGYNGDICYMPDHITGDDIGRFLSSKNLDTSLLGASDITLEAVYTRGEGSEKDGVDAVISAHNFAIAKDEVLNLNDATAIEKADAKAWSKADPNEAVEIRVSGLENVKPVNGEYEITFTAIGNDGNPNSVTVTVVVRDKTGTIIDPNDPDYDGGNSRDGKLSGNDFSYPIYKDGSKDINDDLTEEMAKKLASIYVEDATLSDANVKVYGLDEFNNAKNEQQKGTYEIKFVLEDENGTPIRELVIKVELTGLKSDEITDEDGNVTNKSYITADSFDYGIKKGDSDTDNTPLTAEEIIKRANAKGYDKNGERTDVHVDENQLASLSDAQQSGKIGTFPITFTTDDGASLTIEVTLKDIESIHPAVPDVDEGSSSGEYSILYANNFTYGIYDGEGKKTEILNDALIRQLSDISGRFISFNGTDIKDRPLKDSEITIIADELIAAQESNKSGTYPVTFIGPDGERITITVELMDMIIDIDVFGDGSSDSNSIATTIVEKLKDGVSVGLTYYLVPTGEDTPMPSGTSKGLTKQLIVSATNTEKPILFGKLQFTSDDAGKTYTYLVSQDSKAGSVKGGYISRDKSVYKLTIKLYVNEDGKIVCDKTIEKQTKGGENPIFEATEKMSFVNKYSASSGGGGGSDTTPDTGKDETKPATDETKSDNKGGKSDSSNGGSNTTTETKSYKDTTKETSAASDENKETENGNETDVKINDDSTKKSDTYSKDDTMKENGKTIYPGDDKKFGTEDDYYIDNNPNGKETFIHRGEDGKFDTADDYYYVDLPNGRKAKVFIGDDLKPFTRDDWYQADEGYIVYAGRDGIIGTSDDYYIDENGIKIYAGDDYSFSTNQVFISKVWNIFGDNLGDWAQAYPVAAHLVIIIPLFALALFSIFALTRKKKYVLLADRRVAMIIDENKNEYIIQIEYKAKETEIMKLNKKKDKYEFITKDEYDDLVKEQ